MHIALQEPWEAGRDRHYDGKAASPDPAPDAAGLLWHRRALELPRKGGWTHATLLLHGVGTPLSVYVNGERVAQVAVSPGPAALPLLHPAVKPGATITLEVSATPPGEAPVATAPVPWGDAALHLHGPTRLALVHLAYDAQADKLQVRWELEERGPTPRPLLLKLQLEDQDGTELLGDQFVNLRPSGRRTVALRGAVDHSTPQALARHRVRARLMHKRQCLDEAVLPLALPAPGAAQVDGGGTPSPESGNASPC